MRQIKPINNNGSIQLKVQVSGHTYRFNPVPFGRFECPDDLGRARAIALQMALDLTNGRFDTSLDRYRTASPEPPIKPPDTLIDLWDLWVTGLELPEDTQADHYEMVRRQIAKAKPGLLDTEWFTRCPLAPSTYNSRLGFLVRCLAWGIQGALVSSNPWATVRPRKVIKKQVQPFSPEELRGILDGFRRLYPHYYPFVAFLLATGSRLSEAIGVRWQDIDLTKGTLTISESLSIKRAGNGYSRHRKETKRGTTRTLDLPEALRDLLASQPKGTPGDLVFKSPKGYPIGTSALRDKWVKVLKAAGVPYRNLHVLRHTCLSMALEEGTSLPGVAYLAGHSDLSMVIRTYGHMITRPSLPRVLPDLQDP
jgi:integrase